MKEILKVLKDKSKFNIESDERKGKTSFVCEVCFA